jgi:hypothetical protein
LNKTTGYHPQDQQQSHHKELYLTITAPKLNKTQHNTTAKYAANYALEITGSKLEHAIANVRSFFSKTIIF